MAKIIEKVLAGQEDMLFGQGTVQQFRNDSSVIIKKINADAIPYSGDVDTGNLVSVLTIINGLLDTLANTYHTEGSIQGGGQFEKYHLTRAERDAISNIGETPDHNDTGNIQGGGPGEYLHLTQVEKDAIGGSIVHNNTTGIQGGTTGEYFHLTSAEKDAIGGSIAHNNTTGIQGGEVGDYQHVTQAERNTIATVNNEHVLKTASYQLNNLDNVLVDSSNGAFTLTLPTSPNVGHRISVSDNGGSVEVNNVTIARNGQNIMSLAENMLVDVNYENFTLYFLSVTRGWVLI